MDSNTWKIINTGDIHKNLQDTSWERDGKWQGRWTQENAGNNYQRGGQGRLAGGQRGEGGHWGVADNRWAGTQTGGPRGDTGNGGNRQGEAGRRGYGGGAQGGTGNWNYRQGPQRHAGPVQTTLDEWVNKGFGTWAQQMDVNLNTHAHEQTVRFRDNSRQQTNPIPHA